MVKTNKSCIRFAYKVAADSLSNDSADDLGTKVAVKERRQNVAFLLGVPWKVLLVSGRSIIMLNCSILCHCHNRHAEIDSQRVHIE